MVSVILRLLIIKVKFQSRKEWIIIPLYCCLPSGDIRCIFDKSKCRLDFEKSGALLEGSENFLPFWPIPPLEGLY